MEGIKSLYLEHYDAYISYIPEEGLPPSIIPSPSTFHKDQIGQVTIFFDFFFKEENLQDFFKSHDQICANSEESWSIEEEVGNLMKLKLTEAIQFIDDVLESESNKANKVQLYRKLTRKLYSFFNNQKFLGAAQKRFLCLMPAHKRWALRFLKDEFKSLQRNHEIASKRNSTIIFKAPGNLNINNEHLLAAVRQLVHFKFINTKNLELTRQLRLLLLNQPLNKHICWVGSSYSLAYFIQQLQAKQVFISKTGAFWESMPLYFTINDKALPLRFRTYARMVKEQEKEMIDKIVHNLVLLSTEKQKISSDY